MVELKSNDALICNTYYNMLKNHEFNKKNLDHIKKYIHHEEDNIYKSSGGRTPHCELLYQYDMMIDILVSSFEQ